MEVQRLAVRYLCLRTYKSNVSKLKNNVGGNRSGLKRVVQFRKELFNSVGQLPGKDRQEKYLKGECQP